jgi:hypothetical protein
MIAIKAPSAPKDAVDGTDGAVLALGALLVALLDTLPGALVCDGCEEGTDVKLATTLVAFLQADVTCAAVPSMNLIAAHCIRLFPLASSSWVFIRVLNIPGTAFRPRHPA